MGSTIESDLKNAKKNLNQLNEVDGSSEIIVGITSIFASLDLVFNYPTLNFIYLLVIGLFLGLNKFKKRYTYTRIGYYRLKNDSKKFDKEWVGVKLLIIFLSIIIVGSLVSSGLDKEFAYPTLFGFFIFLASIYLVVKTGVKKYYILGLSALISGIIYSGMEFSSVRKQIGTFLFMWGFIFLILGIVKFKLFTINYPISNQN